jgi:hypothetical protein
LNSSWGFEENNESPKDKWMERWYYLISSRNMNRVSAMLHSGQGHEMRNNVLIEVCMWRFNRSLFIS